MLRTAPHSDFGLHDARVAPLQNLILREDTFVVIASIPLGKKPLQQILGFAIARFSLLDDGRVRWKGASLLGSV